MVENPVVKPRVATVALVLTSVGVLILLVLFLAIVPATSLPLSVSLPLVAVWLAAGLLLGWQWWKRITRSREWQASSAARWRAFNTTKQSSGTTTEVTLLSVDAVQPTGSWVTILWNRFEHVQPAWLEALPEPVWPGSILLLAPDPAQIMPGLPWPETYFIRAANCLAWAPAQGWRA
ncbi:hypothetical protein ACTHQ6_09460 [Arthrobacter sp. SAFR-179]|uniref:hypothetical protein n=1 Tax=Arthrobacter sp. SAFR-179 TaxID=3387279 RepID=UPI003F7BBA59